jgi:hypothetical protein
MIIQFGFLKQGTTAPTNFYTVANALSSDVYEAPGTTGLGTNGVTLSDEISTQHDGTYALKVVNIDGSSDRLEIDLTLLNSTNYQVKVWIKKDALSQWLPRTWVGTTAPSISPDFETASTTWQEFTITFTTTATAVKMRYYNEGVTGGGESPYAYWMDNFRLYIV